MKMKDLKRDFYINSNESVDGFIKYILANQDYMLAKINNVNKKVNNNRIIAALVVGAYVCYKKGAFNFIFEK